MNINTISKHLKIWWKNFTMSPTERWLAESADVVELEHRLRRHWGYDSNFNHLRD